MKVMHVFAHMVDTDDKEFRLAPISNIMSARKTKHGTQITMGIGDDIVGKIMNDELVGGFIFCDRKHFREVQEKLETPDTEGR